MSDTINQTTASPSRAPRYAVLALVLAPWLPLLLPLYQIVAGVYEGGEQAILPMVVSIALSVCCSVLFVLPRIRTHFSFRVLVGVWAPLLLTLTLGLIGEVLGFALGRSL